MPRRRHAIPATRVRSRGRRGFTLVELLVAIVILAVGVLGLASTAAVVMRQIGGGAQQSRAASLAQTRFEQLRAFSCAQYGALPYRGSATTEGFRESWAVTNYAGTTNVGAAGRTLIDSVFYDANGRQQVRVFRSMRTC